MKLIPDTLISSSVKLNANLNSKPRGFTFKPPVKLIRANPSRRANARPRTASDLT